MVSPDTLKAFGLALREARVDQKLTLAAVSPKAFATVELKGFVSQTENGRRSITAVDRTSISKTPSYTKGQIFAPGSMHVPHSDNVKLEESKLEEGEQEEHKDEDKRAAAEQPSEDIMLHIPKVVRV